MSEEIEEIEEFEEGIDLEELAKRYETKGFFSRLKSMFVGLRKPKSSREYKLARIELQRLMAPLIAIVSVLVLVGSLIVFTMVSEDKTKKLDITVAKVEEADNTVEEQQEEEPPDEPPPEPPPMEDVEITVDNPTPGPVSPMTPTPSPPSPQVSVKPATQDTVAIVNSPVKMKSMVGSRTPGSIGAMTKGGANFGDPNTERAVFKALRWLKKTQNSDGSWQGASGSRDQSKAAATGLAVLTFLAHGETPANSREFKETVTKAIDWLVSNQKQVNRNGETVWSCTDPGSAEYGFIIATYALSEAFGMTKNPNVKEAARRGLERIVTHQSPTGGWNYYLCPDANKTANGVPDDISYGGWCIQAIKAGKLAGIHVDGMEECIKKAIRCLKERNYYEKTGFSYRPGSNGYAGLGGVGCLAMQLLGYGKEPQVRNALKVMRDWVPCFDDANTRSHERPPGGWSSPQYYYYYAAQCKFQAGMAKDASQADQVAWQDWNKAMKAFYPNKMIDAGEIPGPDGKPVKCAYWQNRDHHSVRPVMDTCLAALQLMVYYRYLPQATLSVAEEKTSGAEAATDKSSDVTVDVDI